MGLSRCTSFQDSLFKSHSRSSSTLRDQCLAGSSSLSASYNTVSIWTPYLHTLGSLLMQMAHASGISKLLNFAGPSSVETPLSVNTRETRNSTRKELHVVLPKAPLAAHSVLKIASHVMITYLRVTLFATTSASLHEFRLGPPWGHRSEERNAAFSVALSSLEIQQGLSELQLSYPLRLENSQASRTKLSAEL